MSAYVQRLEMVDIGESLDAAREKLGDKLDTAKEGVGAVKEKLGGMTGGKGEEGEARELRR